MPNIVNILYIAALPNDVYSQLSQFFTLRLILFSFIVHIIQTTDLCFFFIMYNYRIAYTTVQPASTFPIGTPPISTLLLHYGSKRNHVTTNCSLATANWSRAEHLTQDGPVQPFLQDFQILEERSSQASPRYKI